MLYFKDQFVTIWKVEEEENRSTVTMSSSRKDKKTGEYHNSNWSFVSFVGEAHKKIQKEGLAEKAKIRVNGSFNWEPYLKEGVKTWAKNPRIVVFGYSLPEESGNGGSRMDTPPVVQSDDDDEIPF